MAQLQPVASATLAPIGEGVVTSMVVTEESIIVGLDNGNLYIFDHDCTNQRVISVGETALWALDTWGDESVVVGGSNGLLGVWDLTTLNQKSDFRGHTSTVRCAKFYAECKVVSASADATIRLWDVETGDCTGVLEGHTQTVRSLAVSDKIIASASYDFDGRVWDMDTKECLHILRGHENSLLSVAFNGTRIVTSSLDKTARIWDSETGSCLAMLRPSPTPAIMGQLHLLADTIMTGDSEGQLRRWSISDFVEGWRVQAHTNAITCIDSNDGKILTGGKDGGVKEYDSARGELIHLYATSDAVWKVAYASGRAVAILAKEEQVVLCVWNVEQS